MREKYLNLIQERYDHFENTFLKNNPILGKSTADGYWGATHLNDLFDLFNRLNISKDSSFVDLGSGDGRVLFSASLFSNRVVGIESDKDLNFVALNIKNELMHSTVNKSLPIHEQIKQNCPFKFVNIIENDFKEHNLSYYDYVYISPDKAFYRDGVEKKLKNELNGKLIVQSMEFAPSTLKLVDEFLIEHSRFRIYENPNPPQIVQKRHD